MSKRSRRQHPASRNNRRANIDQARRLPRYDPEYCAAEDDLLEETLNDVLAEPELIHPNAKASPGDLRGIPVVGSGQGATPGTNPEDCIDRIDTERGAA